MSVTKRQFGQDVLFGFVDPIWIVRLALPDRSETIVIMRQGEGANDGDLQFIHVNEFAGSRGESITVSGVGIVGCGPGIILDEGCHTTP